MKKSEREAQDKIRKLAQRNPDSGIHVSKKGARGDAEYDTRTLKEGPLSRLIRKEPKRK